MEWAGQSAYTEFAEWDGNPHKYSFGTYAGFNSRYAYNRLQSITPSDDISADKTTPNAELFCENANSIRNLMLTAIGAANTEIYAKAKQQPELTGMGTTAVVIILKEKEAYISHVGDSRVYLFRNNELTQMTTDHSIVQELIALEILQECPEFERDENGCYPTNQVLAGYLKIAEMIIYLYENIALK